MNLEARYSSRDILSRQTLFDGLSEAGLDALAQGACLYKAHRHEIIFSKGDTARGLYLVVSGQVKVFLPSQKGWEKVLCMAGPGACLGETAMYLEAPHLASAQAEADSMIFMITTAAFLKTLALEPNLAQNLLRHLSQSMYELLRDIESCTIQTSAQRVKAFLLHLVPDGETEEYVIALPSNKQTIASQLNLAPETLSRILGNLSSQGLIEVKGRSITVLDRDRLNAFNA